MRAVPHTAALALDTHRPLAEVVVVEVMTNGRLPNTTPLLLLFLVVALLLSGLFQGMPIHGAATTADITPSIGGMQRIALQHQRTVGTAHGRRQHTLHVRHSHRSRPVGSAYPVAARSAFRFLGAPRSRPYC